MSISGQHGLDSHSCAALQGEHPQAEGVRKRVDKSGGQPGWPALQQHHLALLPGPSVAGSASSLSEWSLSQKGSVVDPFCATIALTLHVWVVPMDPSTLMCTRQASRDMAAGSKSIARNNSSFPGKATPEH